MDTTEPVPLPKQPSPQLAELRERFSDEEISDVIDYQVERWSLRALSRHPALLHSRLADYITRQVAGDSSATPEQNGFAEAAKNIFSDEDSLVLDDLRQHRARIAQDAERSREILRGVAQETGFDDLAIEDPYFHELFEAAHSFEDNPHTPEAYGVALQAVKRLYVHCEDQAKKQNIHDFGQRYYAIILEKLASELVG